MTPNTLDGSRAVVTGGSSGIGLATAKALHAAGATVAIVGRDPGKLSAAATAIGGNARTIAVDLGSQNGARTMAEQLRDFGPLDVLIANAGASNAPELWDTSETEFDQVITANLKSTFFTITETRHLLALAASVILTSSVAHDRGRLGDPLYAAVKAAVRSLGRGFAADPDLLKHRVRVNTISFGAVTTPMTSSQDHATAHALSDWAQQNVPIGRWGTVDEAAAAMLFLAGPGSSYMTGAELPVDGGLAQI